MLQPGSPEISVIVDVIEMLLLSRMVLMLTFNSGSYFVYTFVSKKHKGTQCVLIQRQLTHLAIFIRVYLSSKHDVIGSSGFPNVDDVL